MSEERKVLHLLSFVVAVQAVAKLDHVLVGSPGFWVTSILAGVCGYYFVSQTWKGDGHGDR